MTVHEGLVIRMNEGSPDRVWTTRSVQAILSDFRLGEMVDTNHDREFDENTAKWRSRGPSARWFRLGLLAHLLAPKHRDRYWAVLRGARDAKQRAEKKRKLEERKRQEEAEAERAALGQGNGHATRATGGGFFKSNGFARKAASERTPHELDAATRTAMTALEERWAAIEAGEEEFKRWLAKRRPPD